MIETFAALLFAHVLADFVLQSDRMVASKRPGSGLFELHVAIVFLTAWVATGTLPGPALLPLAILTLAHGIIDFTKANHLQGKTVAGFLVDQAAHLVTLAIVAALAPALWESGFWAGQEWLAPAMTLATGALVATRVGGFAIGALMQRFERVKLPRGLPEGGRLIGLLERGMIWLLILVGQPGGVGFLIAAKSVLRFDTASKDQRAGEYVIIGTLASFGWAIGAGYGTLWLLGGLPPIGFPAPPP